MVNDIYGIISLIIGIISFIMIKNIVDIFFLFKEVDIKLDKLKSNKLFGIDNILLWLIKFV